MTKSQLVEKLHQVSRGVSRRIGLTPATEVQLPAIILLASLRSTAAELAQAVLQAGADALICPGQLPGKEDSTIESQAFHSLLEIAGDRPCGVTLEDTLIDASKVERLGTLGLDFVCFRANQAAAILRLSHIGKVLSIDLSHDPRLLATLNDLPIDALQLNVNEGQNRPPILIVQDLIRYRQVCDVIRKPVLVSSQGVLQPDDLVQLRDLGIEGVILEMTPGMNAQEAEARVASFHTVIKGLGRPLGRTRLGDVLIPPISGRPQEGILKPEAPEE